MRSRPRSTGHGMPRPSRRVSDPGQPVPVSGERVTVRARTGEPFQSRGRAAARRRSGLREMRCLPRPQHPALARWTSRRTCRFDVPLQPLFSFLFSPLHTHTASRRHPCSRLERRLGQRATAGDGAECGSPSGMGCEEEQAGPTSQL